MYNRKHQQRNERSTTHKETQDMASKTPTITADEGGTCSCCGRTHRHLTMIDGYWMGKTCKGYYKDFLARYSYLKGDDFRTTWRNLCAMTGRSY